MISQIRNNYARQEHFRRSKHSEWSWRHKTERPEKNAAQVQVELINQITGNKYAEGISVERYKFEVQWFAVTTRLLGYTATIIILPENIFQTEKVNFHYCSLRFVFCTSEMFNFNISTTGKLLTFLSSRRLCWFLDLQKCLLV